MDQNAAAASASSTNPMPTGDGNADLLPTPAQPRGTSDEATLGVNSLMTASSLRSCRSSRRFSVSARDSTEQSPRMERKDCVHE